MYRRKSGFFKQKKITDIDMNKNREVLEVKYNWNEDEESEDGG